MHNLCKPDQNNAYVFTGIKTIIRTEHGIANHLTIKYNNFKEIPIR